MTPATMPKWASRAIEKADRKREHARQLIRRCQADLGYELSEGQMRDLLADNTNWDMDVIAACVSEIRFSI